MWKHQQTFLLLENLISDNLFFKFKTVLHKHKKKFNKKYILTKY